MVIFQKLASGESEEYAGVVVLYTPPSALLGFSLVVLTVVGIVLVTKPSCPLVSGSPTDFRAALKERLERDVLKQRLGFVDSKAGGENR